MTAIAVEHEHQPAHPVDEVATRHARIPLTRVVAVELRKMFDTRSGFWLMASIVITATLATAAVVLFAPDDELTYGAFAGSIGVPMTVILPMMAILAVTSEWTQRSGLTTFTLVPHRGRIIGGKAIAAVLVGAAAIPLALAIGALGNVVGTAITGTDIVWDISFSDGLYIVLGNVLGLLVGFMLGILIRNSAGAIVAYFVYSLLFPTIFSVLAENQQWFKDLRPWVDFNFAQGALYDGHVTGEQWANLATAGTIWLILPMVVGLMLVRRSEVK